MKIDEELAPFLRSVGNVADSLGTTLSAAMSKIDRRSLETLEPYIKRLQSRLRSQISPKVCWNRFKDETGSEMVSRATTMFVDGTSLGGSPERVGQISSDYAMDIALLRAKRHVTALPFAYLTIPLHGAMSALLIFILGVMGAFNGRLMTATDELTEQAGGAAALPALPVFQTQDLGMISVLTMIAVIILTVSNTLAAKWATGGHSLMLAFYGSIMCCLSGVNLLLIPPISHSVLS